MIINPTTILEKNIVYVSDDKDMPLEDNQLQQSGIDLRLDKVEIVTGPMMELYRDKERIVKPNLVSLPYYD